MKLGFIKPSVVAKEDGSVVIEPLQGGFGHTLGNTLRRILMSSIPGTSAIGLEIPYVLHELSEIEGSVTETLELKMNLKTIRFQTTREGLHTVRFSSNRKGVHTAKDLIPGPYVEVLNPEAYLINLTGEKTVDFTIYVRNGIGYIDEKEHKDFEIDEVEKMLIDGEWVDPTESIPSFLTESNSNIILIDGLFSPITHVNYEVEDVRLGRKAGYERLILQVETDGSIQPKDAILTARKILIDYLEFDEIPDYIEQIEIFKEEEEEKIRNKILDMNINELVLKPRSYKHLTEAGYTTVRQLVELTKDELKKVRQLGSKSVEDVIVALDSIGLQLKKK